MASRPRPNRQTACDLCRTRRVRCDAGERISRGHPNCSQCELKAQVCTFGYRHSHSVISHHQKKRKAAANVSVPYETLLQLMDYAHDYLEAQRVILPALDLNHDVRGQFLKCSIWTKVVACIGCLWCNDGKIIGCEVEEVNGRYSEEVLVSRRKLHAKLYDEVVLLIDELVARSQPASLPEILAVHLYAMLPRPILSREVARYSFIMIEEWIVRQIHVESKLRNGDSAYNRLLLASFQLDSFVCLLTGKMPIIRPEDILSDEQINHDREKVEPLWRPMDLTGDPWDAQKDCLIIIQELFKNFVVARAVMDNVVKDPGPKFDHILQLMRFFCLNHTELRSLTSKPLGSLSNGQTMHYLMANLQFTLLVIKLWEIGVVIERQKQDSPDIAGLLGSLNRVKLAAIRACIDLAQMLDWAIKSGSMNTQPNSRVRSAVQAEPGPVSIVSSFALRALRSWERSVTAENIVSWFGEEFAEWSIDKTADVYLHTLYHVSEIQEKALGLYLFHMGATNSVEVLRDNLPDGCRDLLGLEIDPNTLDPSSLATIGDPFRVNFQDTWNSILTTISTFNNLI
uniref:ARAD1C45628p n=1 Tax=Blastobotrys adeninivorans TaxID=409370 RepID=A0A060T4J0_BLAAD